MKLKIIDVTTVVLIALGISLTVLTFLAMRGQSVDVHHIQAIVPADASGKSQIKLSKVRPFVRNFVEEVSRDAKQRGLGESSEEKKNKMVESIIAGMKAQGAYDFVDN
jgi:hypothetical protein